MHLMIDPSTNQILNYGQPPWSNADQYPTAIVMDIGAVSPPNDDLRNYQYIDGTFIYTPLPPTAEEVQAEADRQAFHAEAALALFGKMDDDLAIILDTASTAQARWAAVARTIQRQALIVRYLRHQR